MNDLKLLNFVCLALQDHHTKDRESLIDYACQYGRRYGVTKEEVERIIDKKLVEFLYK